ncbi:MAG: hypothetical protein ACI82G_000235, partial [Bradymonadia bacterium]
MRLIVAYILISATLLAFPAQAQAPIAHEYFEYRATDADVPAGQLDLPRPGAVAAQENADVAPPIATAEGLIADGAPESPSEGMGGQSNAPESVDDAVRLDRETGPEGQLQYAAVFSPAVTPFKRLGARDRAVLRGGEWALDISSTELVEVPLTEEQDGDAFFQGRVVLDARDGVPIPLPSVSPDMRVHAMETSPRVDVTVYRDGAGNYFAAANRSGAVDLRYFVSARRAYFGGPLPEPRALQPSLAPSALRADASAVLRAIGASEAQTDVELVVSLLRWFRGFDARPFPESSRGNNAYLDLAMQRIGVCRHRSQTFVLTALAAGLGARYLYNDAHAFVEVELANGWRRFDLGGASDGLDVLGAQNAAFDSPEDATIALAPINGSPSSPELNAPDTRTGETETANSGSTEASASDAAESLSGDNTEYSLSANGADSRAGEFSGQSSGEARGAENRQTLRELVASQQAPGAHTAEVEMIAGQQVVTFEDAPPI